MQMDVHETLYPFYSTTKMAHGPGPGNSPKSAFCGEQ